MLESISSVELSRWSCSVAKLKPVVRCITAVSYRLRLESEVSMNESTIITVLRKLTTALKVTICSRWRDVIGMCLLCTLSGLWLKEYMGDRDGQKRPVFIYRFLTTGAIDGRPIYHCTNCVLSFMMQFLQRRYTSVKSQSWAWAIVWQSTTMISSEDWLSDCFQALMGSVCVEYPAPKPDP